MTTFTVSNVTRGGKFSSTTAVEEPSSTFLDMPAQRAAVAAERMAVADAQVSRWQERHLTGVAAELRIGGLLREAFRHELRKVDTTQRKIAKSAATQQQMWRKSGGVSATLCTMPMLTARNAMDEACARRREDLRTTYRALILEAQRLVRVRSQEQMPKSRDDAFKPCHSLASTLIQCFAAMQPWCDSALLDMRAHNCTIDTLGMEHALVHGSSGDVLMPVSLAAAQMISARKTDGALNRRRLIAASATVALQQALCESDPMCIATEEEANSCNSFSDENTSPSASENGSFRNSPQPEPIKAAGTRSRQQL